MQQNGFALDEQSSIQHNDAPQTGAHQLVDTAREGCACHITTHRLMSQLAYAILEACLNRLDCIALLSHTPSHTPRCVACVHLHSTPLYPTPPHFYSVMRCHAVSVHPCHCCTRNAVHPCRAYLCLTRTKRQDLRGATMLHVQLAPVIATCRQAR